MIKTWYPTKLFLDIRPSDRDIWKVRLTSRHYVRYNIANNKYNSYKNKLIRYQTFLFVYYSYKGNVWDITSLFFLQKPTKNQYTLHTRPMCMLQHYTCVWKMSRGVNQALVVEVSLNKCVNRWMSLFVVHRFNIL